MTVKLASRSPVDSTGLADLARTGGGFLPTNAIFQTLPRYYATAATGTLNTGQIRLSGDFVLPAGRKISSLTVVSGSTALVTGTNQWFALYDTSLNRLAVTVDDLTTAWAANTAKTLVITGGYTPLVDTAAYLGVMVAATTPPSLMVTTAANAAVNNTIGGVAPATGFHAASGLTTPATAPNPAALSANAAQLFYGYGS